MKRLIVYSLAAIFSLGIIGCCATLGNQHVCITNPTPTPTATVTQAPVVTPTPTPFGSATPTVEPSTPTSVPSSTPVSDSTPYPPTIDMTAAGQPVPSGTGMEITQHYLMTPSKIDPRILPEMPDPGNPANADFWANKYAGKQAAKNCDEDHFYDPTGKPALPFYACGGSVKLGWKPRGYDVARADQPFQVSCTAPSTLDKYPARDYYQAIVSGSGGTCTVCVPRNATTVDGILMPVAVACFTRPVV